MIWLLLVKWVCLVGVLYLFSLNLAWIVFLLLIFRFLSFRMFVRRFLLNRVRDFLKVVLNFGLLWMLLIFRLSCGFSRMFSSCLCMRPFLCAAVSMDLPCFVVDLL